MPRLLLIDATGCLFRAFHAAPDLRAQDGSPTGAVFVLANILSKIRRQWPAEFAACVMDAKGPTFRHELHPAYKATRPPLADDLRVQIAPAAEFIRATGCPLLSVPGIEADDVIAALALRAAADGCEVVVASSDKDLTQIVSDSVQMVDGMKDKIYDAAAVREKFGVSPAQMGDFLALAGDSSDNIPGVKKVGAKTAAKWLNQFGDLDAVVKNAGEVSGAVGENLRAAVADGSLALSRKLTALKTDADVGAEWRELVPKSPDEQQWRALCERHNFRNLAGAMREFAAPESGDEKESARTVVIRDLKVLKEWAAKIKRAGAFAFDAETVGDSPMSSQLVGFSLAAGDDEAAYVPLAHKELTPQLSRDAALNVLAPLLADAKIVKVAHNAKFDLHIMANYGLGFAGIVEDTKLAAFAREPGMQNNLAALAARHLGAQKTTYKDLVSKRRKDAAKDFSEVDIALAAPYAASDSECAWKLRAVVIGGMDKRSRKLYEEMDRPLIPVLLTMERAGVMIDSGELQKLATHLRARMGELEEEARNIAGEKFNLNSPKQLAKMLYDRFGAAVGRKTATGARSTDERTLEKLAADYPLAKVALEHRSLAKLAGTYAEKLPLAVLPQTGRVHTDFSQTGAVTGRLSSSNPNLQNIPVRTELGRRIRRAFVSPPGSVLISADYSQIELRLMAHVSGDDALRAAFARGADIHRQTAAEVFKVPDSEVTSGQRRAAKAINFGLMYGMSAFGLAQGIGVSRDQARHYMDLYFSRYPGVADYMERARKESVGRGYSETLFGRRVPVLARGQGAERAAINAPMQGGAADLMKLAMIAADAWLRESGMRTRMLLQVHDELILESPESEVAEASERIRELMEGASELSVPLKAEVRTGGNWDEAH